MYKNERRATLGYAPSLKKSLSNRVKRNDQETSKIEVIKDEMMFKAMPLVELHSEKRVSWAAVAEKHILPAVDGKDAELFEEMMLRFCPDEQRLKLINGIKQGITDNIEKNKQGRTNKNIQDEIADDKDLTKYLFAHSLIKAGEKMLLKSAGLNNRRKTANTPGLLSQPLTSKSNRNITDDSNVKSLKQSKTNPFSELLRPFLPQSKRKNVGHRLLGPM